MYKKLIFLVLSLSMLSPIWSQEETEVDSATINEWMAYYTELNEFQNNIDFKSGFIQLSDRVQLSVPIGYKYINKSDSHKILFELWNNPERDDILGMLVLDSFHLANPDDWAFVVSEELEGYVKDGDAEDIDYDDMMKELKKEETEVNEARAEAGYGPIRTIGWASKPFYDKEAKILHWAKELNFDNAEDNTLNYDVRILGRQGLLSLNAVGPINALESVQKHIPEIIHIASFSEGNTYADFNPSIDKVAAYTVGGLVAGKILAKAGLLALLLKNIKLIAIGVIGLFSLFRNKIFAFLGGKSQQSPKATKPEDLS
jgi:uncharacterized membrane-anchored protein